MKSLLLVCASTLLVLNTPLVQAHQAFEEDELSNIGQQHDELHENLESNLNTDLGSVGLEMPLEAKKTIKQMIIQFLSHEPSWYWKYYKLELGYLALIVVLIVNLFQGKEINKSIANNWRKNCIPSLFQQFTHLGCSKDDKNVNLVQKSYTEFDYFASGRKNVIYTMFKINLKRRMCLITDRIVDPYLGRQDTFTMEIPIDLKGRELPLEFLILPKSDLKAFYSTHPYAESMLRNSNSKHLKQSEVEMRSKSSLMVMSEHDEITSQIINQSIGEILLKNGTSGLLKLIHVTDQKVYNQFALMLVATFNIPTMGDHENEDKLFRLMHSIFEIVDAVANIKHSPTVLAKCEKNRKKQVQEAKAKQQELEDERKVETKRLQIRSERERLSKMTPDQQRKYEAKQEKKEAAGKKKKLMKVTKV